MGFWCGIISFTLSEEPGDSALSSFHGEVLRCSGWDFVATDSVTYLNDWCELLDERPLWHEPWPDAQTGLRLAFTDKHEEGRPKLPLGRWRCRLSLSGDQKEREHGCP